MALDVFGVIFDVNLMEIKVAYKDCCCVQSTLIYNKIRRRICTTRSLRARLLRVKQLQPFMRFTEITK